MLGFSPKKEMSLGILEEDKYTNEYFRIKITIPED